jgi:hypothetical protein
MIEDFFPHLPPDEIKNIRRLVSECEPFLLGESDDLDVLIAIWEQYQPEYANVELEVEKEFRAMRIVVNGNRFDVICFNAKKNINYG